MKTPQPPNEPSRFPLAFWVRWAVKIWIAVVFLAALWLAVDAASFLGSLPAKD